MKLKELISTLIKDYKSFIVSTNLPSKKSSGEIRVLQTSRISSPITRHLKTESIEQVIMNLTDALKKAGIDVFVAATGDSKPYNDFNILPTIKKSHDLTYINRDHEMKTKLIREHYIKAIKYATNNNFDIIHDHYKLIEIPEFDDFLYKVEMPAILSTLHVPLERVGSYESIKRTSKKSFFSVVSESQRKIFIERLGLDPSRIFSVHNGIDLEDFSFQREKSDYLFFMGRINQDKGVHTACKLAKETNNSLVISGYYDDSDEIKRKYFDNKVKPYIDIELDIIGEEPESYKKRLLQTVKDNPGKIIHVGRSNLDQRSILYKNAKAYLFTSGMENDWVEPFGFVIIEANASGTPVIAFENGAVKEIIEKNINGITASDYEGLVKASKEIDKINPDKCRKHIESNFTSDITAAKYIDLYREIIKRHKKERL